MRTPVERAFPRAAGYRALFLRGAGTARERLSRDPDASCPSERHLRCIWADPALRPQALVTVRGEPVTVVSPGTWNLEAGPDFIDSELVIGPGHRRLVGDTELHLRPTDWKQHRHTGDPAYNRVIAHVTWMPGALPDGVLPPGAVEISLRDAMRSNPRFAFDAVDVTAYPFAELRPQRPCAVALAKWDQAGRTALLESAGQERLRLKASSLSDSIAERGDAEQVLHEAICHALGYKNNRAPFRRLAAQLPVEALRSVCGTDVVAAYSLMAGVAGLLPSELPSGCSDESRKFVRRMWDGWWKQESAFGPRALSRSEWRLSGTRPQNHPLRRMAAAAALAVARQPPGARLLALDPSKPAAWLKGVSAMFRQADAAFPFWRRHLGLTGKACGPVALVGPERIAAIVSNVFVPYLAASGVNIEPLLAILPAEADNALVRRTAHALFGHDHNPAMYRSGLAQQGLMQIAHDFCIGARKGCPDCALAQAILRAEGCVA